MIVAARIAEFDEAIDLALMEADIKPAQQPVEIAPEEDLQPNMKVTRLRFTAPRASSGDGYPKVSSKDDRVASLPLDENGRQRVQLDAPLGVSATEGAFFDAKGRLVGIATRKQGPNDGFILPARHIAELIQGVLIVFDPPPVVVGDLARPRSWTIALKRWGSGAVLSDLTVSLIVSASRFDHRAYPMEPSGEGQFRADVVPLPAGADPRVALINSIGFWPYPVTSIVNDMMIRVGELPIRLSELAYVENEPMPRAITRDGRTLKGPVAGMESIHFSRGAGGGDFVFARLSSFMVRPTFEFSATSALEVEIEVRRRGATLSRMKRSVKLNPPPGAASECPVVGTLPQPSDELESLLDTKGWLDLRARGAGHGCIGPHPGGRDRRGSRENKEDDPTQSRGHAPKRDPTGVLFW